MNPARSSFDRFKSAATVSVSRKPGTTRYLGLSVYRIAIGHDQGRCSPISMELLQTMQQGLSDTEGQPCSFAYLVNLPLRQILKVGVGDHDGGWRPGRMFNIHQSSSSSAERAGSWMTAMCQNTSSEVVQLMRMSNNAREYLRLQIHNRASYISFADIFTVS